MNKVIHFSSQTLNSLHKNASTNISECSVDDATKKINNEKMKNEKKSYIDLLDKVSIQEVPNAIISIYDNYDSQLILIQKLYKGIPFYEQKYFSQALKNKLDCYKQQDIKKKYDDYNNFITLENIIEKLVTCSMLCFYCNVKTLILFKNSRESCQWTLDRINNYDEHSNSNTIICCLKCNLQRRRKNSAKFKFSKQLEHNLITLKKLE
uniref:Uncharacterized protein n=1 Tax=viral metagenome TaxID=1070528 RepID=A0A6C0D5C6_9ZZZZ